jgi:hypothetical protein
MKTTILALFAALLFISPAFAAKPKKETIPESKCTTVDDAKKQLKAQQDGSAIEYEITGDELKKLNALAAKLGSNAPEGMDTLLIFSKPNNPTFLGMVFVKGCITQLFPVSAEGFKKLLEKSKDDGQI